MAENQLQITLQQGDDGPSYTYSATCESEEDFFRAAEQVDSRLQQLLDNLRGGGTVQNVEGLAGFAEELRSRQ